MQRFAEETMKLLSSSTKLLMRSSRNCLFTSSTWLLHTSNLTSSSIYFCVETSSLTFCSWIEAEKACTRVLQQHRNVKGLFRRGKARSMLGRNEEAIQGERDLDLRLHWINT